MAGAVVLSTDMRRTTIAVALLAALPLLAQEPPQQTRIVSLYGDFDLITGLFRVQMLSTIDWPEPIAQSSEEEWRAIEDEAATLRVENPYAPRIFMVRAYDARREVVHRQIIRIDVLPGCGGPPLLSDHEPAAQQAYHPPEVPRTISYVIRIPLARLHTIEVRTLKMGHVVRWTLRELQRDPSIEKHEVLFRQ